MKARLLSVVYLSLGLMVSTSIYRKIDVQIKNELRKEHELISQNNVTSISSANTSSLIILICTSIYHHWVIMTSLLATTVSLFVRGIFRV